MTDTDTNTGLRHIEDVDSKLANRLIKLVALANGSGATEAEMEAALTKAQEMAIAHRIDLASISASDAGVSAPEPLVESGLIVGSGKRRPPANKHICAILGEFFNVEVLYGTSWSETSRKPDMELDKAKNVGRINPMDGAATVYFLGKRSDVAFAKYAYQFLKYAFARAWRDYRHRTFAPMSSRASFYYGTWLGLDNRLRKERGEAETKALAASEVSNEVYALAVVNEKESRQSFMRSRYHRITTVRETPSNLEDDDAIGGGYGAGGKIRVARGLRNSSASKTLGEEDDS